MGRLADISLGDIVRAGSRYRPVALTVAAILGIVWAFPAPAGLDHAAGPSARAPLLEATDDTEGQAGTEEPAAPQTPQPPGAALDVAASAPEYEAPTVDSTSTPASSSASAYSPPPSGGSGYAVTEEFARAGTDEPLTVAGSGWASREAGTPLATTGVPEGTLPVGNRFGSEDKVSFVRLQGGESTLTLNEDSEGARDMAGAPEVQICKVNDAGWDETEAMSFDEAPEWDPEYCVPGERAEDGTWTFDLLVFPTRTDAAGFALVPGEDAPVDFQVTFTLAA